MPELVIQLGLPQPRARRAIRRRLQDWAQRVAPECWHVDTDAAHTAWNLGVETTDVARCWESLAPLLAGLRRGPAGTIVVAQGAHGWDDYLLLFHSNRAQPLDRLEPGPITGRPSPAPP